MSWQKLFANPLSPAVRWKRVRAGYYTAHLAGEEVGSIVHERTEYGDEQWIVDLTDAPAQAGCDTLACAKTTLIRALSQRKWAHILESNRLPPAPEPVDDARWIARTDDWWIRTKTSGWYWLDRRNSEWVKAPHGPQ